MSLRNYFAKLVKIYVICKLDFTKMQNKFCINIL